MNVKGKPTTDNRRLNPDEAELYQEWITKGRELHAILTLMCEVQARHRTVMERARNNTAKVDRSLRSDRRFLPVR